MDRTSDIKEHMEVIGADGVHVGTVDKVEGDRIKLTKKDSGQGSHQGHHHYLSTGLVAGVEGDKVRLSATAANAFMFEEEEDEGSARLVTGGQRSRSPDGQKRQDDRSSGRDWTGIGLGAAAIATAAAAAAAFYASNQKSSSSRSRSGRSSSDDFELQLQTDENIRLISSSKVEGTSVIGRNGETLGKIENFMVDKYTGRVAYAVLSFGGTMGFGGSLFPLPWSYLTYDDDKDGYVLDITKEQLADAPKFKPSEEPEFSGDYRRVIFRFYEGSAY